MSGGFFSRRGAGRVSPPQTVPGLATATGVPSQPPQLPPEQNTSHVPSRYRHVHWGPFTGLFGVLAIYIAGQFAAALAIMVVLRLAGWDGQHVSAWFEHATLAQFTYILLFEIITVGSVLWLVRKRRSPLGSLGINRPRLRHVGVALIGIGVYIAGYTVVMLLISTLFSSFKLDQEQDLGFSNPGTSIDMALMFISLAILPPVAEEVAFRGFLFAGLRSRWRLLPAVLVTSLLFGIAHLEIGGGGPLVWGAAVDTCILSMVLCGVREYSGSLWPGIYIHALKNMLAFGVLYVWTGMVRF